MEYSIFLLAAGSTVTLYEALITSKLANDFLKESETGNDRDRMQKCKKSGDVFVNALCSSAWRSTVNCIAQISCFMKLWGRIHVQKNEYKYLSRLWDLTTILNFNARVQKCPLNTKIGRVRNNNIKIKMAKKQRSKIPIANFKLLCGPASNNASLSIQFY